MLRLIARGLLKLGGWTRVGERPTIKKAVFVVAPHTSNWDGIWALIYIVAVQLKVHFFAKRSLFWFPLGTVLSALGGIPLDRNEPRSAVRKAVDAYAENDEFYFGLAPEGTRSQRPHWKTGFYRIAEGANVPVILCFLDYGNRRLGIGPTIEITGNRHVDLAMIRDFYEGIAGRWPDKSGPIVFPRFK